MFVSARVLPILVILQRGALALAFTQDLSKLITSKRHSVRAILVLNEKSIRRGDVVIGTPENDGIDRRRFMKDVTGICALSCMSISPGHCDAKSYSENARNLERINAGDFSGGAVYSNNPSTEAGKKRRAMTGCKSPVARDEASDVSLNGTSLSEKDCNSMVMLGETEFMLKALRNLDCPTCPYGIASSR
jgi:hypothetical protein